MIKSDLVRAMWSQLNDINANVSQDECRVVLENMITLVRNTLAEGEDITLAGFGKLYTKQRSATRKTHPQNPSVVIQVPAKTVVKFRPYAELKEKVQTAA